MARAGAALEAPSLKPFPEKDKPALRELYVDMLGAALPRHYDESNVAKLKLDLRAAQAEGFDPKAIYAEAMADRPPTLQAPRPSRA